MSEHRMAPEAAEFPQWREQPRIILPHAKFGGPSIPTEPMGDAQSAFAAAGKALIFGSQAALHHMLLQCLTLLCGCHRAHFG